MQRRIVFSNAIASLSWLLLIFSTNASAQTRSLSAEDLPKLIAQQNPRVLAAQKETESNQIVTNYLQRSLIPSLEVYTTQENFKIGSRPNVSQPTFGILGKLNVYRGGQDRVEDEKRDLVFQKSQRHFERIKAEELLTVRLLYWDILYAKAKLNLLRQMQVTNQQNLAAAQRRIKTGVATESDRVEFEIMDVNLTQDIERLALNEKSAMQNLQIALGLAPSEILVLATEFEHDHSFLENLKFDASESEFLFAENKMNAEISYLEAKKEKRSWLPALDLFAGYAQLNQRDNEASAAEERLETVVGLRLSFTLPNFTETQRQAASFSLKAASFAALEKLQREATQIHLQNEVAELKLLHEQVHRTRENIDRAERYYKLTQSEYNRGVKNSPDVLGASEKLLATKERWLSSIRDFQQGQAHTLSKLGR